MAQWENEKGDAKKESSEKNGKIYNKGSKARNY